MRKYIIIPNEILAIIFAYSGSANFQNIYDVNDVYKLILINKHKLIWDYLMDEIEKYNYCKFVLSIVKDKEYYDIFIKYFRNFEKEYHKVPNILLEINNDDFLVYYFNNKSNQCEFDLYFENLKKIRSLILINGRLISIEALIDIIYFSFNHLLKLCYENKLFLEFDYNFRKIINIFEILDKKLIWSGFTNNSVLKNINWLVNENKLNIMDISYDSYPIYYSCSYGDVEILDILINIYKIDPSIYDNSPIMYAAYDGNPEIVKRLLKDNRVNPGARNNKAIKYACNTNVSIDVIGNYIEVIKILLEDNRVNPSIKNNKPIRNAIKNGNLGIVKFLLNHPRVNLSGDEILIMNEAIRYNCFHMVELLLEDKRFYSIDINKIDSVEKRFPFGDIKKFRKLGEYFKKYLKK